MNGCLLNSFGAGHVELWADSCCSDGVLTSYEHMQIVLPSTLELNISLLYIKMRSLTASYCHLINCTIKLFYNATESTKYSWHQDFATDLIMQRHSDFKTRMKWTMETEKPKPFHIALCLTEFPICFFFRSYRIKI